MYVRIEYKNMHVSLHGMIYEMSIDMTVLTLHVIYKMYMVMMVLTLYLKAASVGYKCS